MARKTQTFLDGLEHPLDREHKKKCKQCIYRYRGTAGHDVWCQYILVEKKRRPCPASECTVFVKGPQKKSREAIYFSNYI